jgi:replication factor C small subunit
MIIPAIQSRCQGFHIEKLDLNEFTARIAEIGISENVKFDLDTLDTYVQATYPDLRKCINLIQQNVVDGELKKPTDSDYSSTSEWMISVVELFKSGEFKKAREIIVTQAKPEEYEEVYRFMYRNLDLWGNTDAQQDQAIVIIRDGMVKSVSCADPEINLSATLIELQLNSM